MEAKQEKKKEVKYEVVVCVKDSGNENGPGHVSGFTQKTQEGKTTIMHTSFYPGLFGSIVNALTLGSVPVGGKLEMNPKQDFEEADHVLTKEVSKQEYKNIKKAQKEFSEDVSTGHRIYSVFGDYNPLANIASSILNGAKGAQLVKEQHKKEYGVEPPEDHCGIHVFSDDVPPPFKKMEVDNCASSVTHILNKGGFTFKNPVIPTLFTPELQNLGFKEQQKQQSPSDPIAKFKQ